jgi:hypothetical protein
MKMGWEKYLKAGSIRRHKTSREEIDALRSVIARDLADAELGRLSHDRKFSSLYNACLQAAKMVIACSGYRVKGSGAHKTTLACLRFAMGKAVDDRVRFLDACRKKRNIATYDRAGIVTSMEVEEINAFAASFVTLVESWISANFPEYA